MTSEYKLNEARFFLNQIDHYYHDLEKCDYCVSAFLHATHDIIDHTFEEYAFDPFSITVPSYHPRKIEKFVEIARQESNQKALGFIEIYIRELYKIYTQPITASLLFIRNVNTHKETMLSQYATWVTSPDGSKHFEKRYFWGTLNLQLSTGIRLENDFKGWVHNRTRRLREHGKLLGIDLSILSDADLDSLFDQSASILTSTDAKYVCKEHLTLLEKFVGAIRAEYPRW